MRKKPIIITIAICAALSGVLGSCAKIATEPVITPIETIAAETTPTPLPDRMGAYLDKIFMFEVLPSQAANQVMDGTLDIYASPLKANQLEDVVQANVITEETVRRQYELLLNPADTSSKTGIINPFSYSEVREALNLVIDRKYITEEFFSGGAVAKYQPLIYKSYDYNLNESVISEISKKYAYDFEKASETITNVLLKNGFKTDENGKWLYKKELVIINILIRNDDESRQNIGEYIAAQLDKLGFTVSKQYVSFSEGNSIWVAGDPREGQWHIYTGIRTFDEAPVNQENVFADNYTDFGVNGEIELYKYFKTEDDFAKDALLLQNGEYETIEIRNEAIKRLISSCNLYSYRIWLVDELSYVPHSEKLVFQNALTTQTNIDFKTSYSINKTNVWGGELNWGADALLKQSVNPVNGSDAASEVQFLNFINLPLIYENSDTAEKKTMFIKNIDMVYQDSINYINDTKFISVETAQEIIVPSDAVISWSEELNAPVYADAQYMNDMTGLATAWLATYEKEKPRDNEKIKKQQEIVNELLAIEQRGYLTANVKYTVEYDESIYSLKWHDGSSFSVADIIMAFITKTQLLDEKSSLYDEYYAQEHKDELEGFKGYRVVSEHPLIIEYYTDDYDVYTSQTVKPFWLDYGTGQQSWAMAAISNNAVMKKTASYSEGISIYYGNDYLNYLDKNIAKDLCDTILETDNSINIPYAELLEPYIDIDTAEQQFNNILKFYDSNKHLLIGIGPYMVENADLLTPSLTLSAFSDFPIKADDLSEFVK